GRASIGLQGIQGVLPRLPPLSLPTELPPDPLVGVPGDLVAQVGVLHQRPHGAHPILDPLGQQPVDPLPDALVGSDRPCHRPPPHAAVLQPLQVGLALRKGWSTSGARQMPGAISPRLRWKSFSGTGSANPTCALPLITLPSKLPWMRWYLANASGKSPQN